MRPQFMIVLAAMILASLIAADHASVGDLAFNVAIVVAYFSGISAGKSEASK